MAYNNDANNEDSAVRIAKLTSEIEHLRASLDRQWTHWMALHHILCKHYHENDGPSRVKIKGEWHEGPVANSYVGTIRALRTVVTDAINGAPRG